MEQTKIEQRKYRRFKTNLLVGVKAVGNAAVDTPQDLKATNISLGGIFLSTPYPFPQNTILELTLQLPGTNKTVKWKGIVRWVSTDPQNPGNGIEFIEMGNIDKDEITKLVSQEAIRELATKCESNKVYKDLLILWNRNKGKSYEYSSLIKFFTLDKAEFDEIVNYFVQLKIFQISGSKIIFLPSPQIVGLEEYIKKIEKS
jgi:hypothetical protein